MSPEEAAYVAGLIDGEGSVSLTRKHRNDNRQLVVTVSNTERNLLEYVQTVTGVGRITTRRTYEPRHTPGMTYQVTNRQALRLLEQIAPYLKSYKANRTSLILEHYLRLTPRNGKYSAELESERSNFIRRFLALRSNARQGITSPV